MYGTVVASKSIMMVSESGEFSMEVNLLVSRLTDMLEDSLAKSQPISRIPNELLCEIFLYMRSACGLYLEDLAEDPRVAGSRIVDDLLALWWPHRWIIVSHICRQWRNVAISCPRLWSQIIVTANDDRITAFLQRSQRFPLAFSKSIIAGTPMSQYVDILNAYLDRTISISCLIVGRGSSELATTVDGVELPLQSIHMSANVPMDFIPVISSAEFPRLRRVDLQAVSYIAVRNLLRPTLTHLTLLGLSAPPSMDTWLTLLCNMPALEELDLNAAIAPHDGSVVTMPPSKQARLENLQSLKVLDYHGDGRYAVAYGNLARNLVFPSTANLTLGTYDPLPTNPHIPTLQAFLRFFAPTSIVCQCFSSTGSDSTTYVYIVANRSIKGSGFVIAMHYRDYTLGFIFKLFRGLRLPSVTSLTIGRLPLGLERALAAMEAALPNVIQLILTGTEAAEMLVQEMELVMEGGPCLEALQSQEAEAETEAEALPFFAKLETLVMENVVWDEEYNNSGEPWKGELLERLETVADWRHEMGSTIPTLMVLDAVHLGDFPKTAITTAVQRYICSKARCRDDDCPCTAAPLD